MLPPYAVQLLPHDPSWAELADREGTRLMEAAPGALVAIHHIGSTSIPGIVAKPIVDLMGIGPNLAAIEAARPALEALGYAWHGEYGLEGRRFCTLSDPVSGARRMHLHCYAAGDHSIRYLRARPDVAEAYQQMKQRCAASHPHDSNAYTDCKDNWIKRVEAEALKFF